MKHRAEVAIDRLEAAGSDVRRAAGVRETECAAALRELDRVGRGGGIRRLPDCRGRMTREEGEHGTHDKTPYL
jgi:hypothetical protein